MTVCNPPPGIPKWAVDSGYLENDGVSSEVIDDGHVVELTDPLIDSVEKTPTVQSEAVVESDTDSDFALDSS